MSLPICPITRSLTKRKSGYSRDKPAAMHIAITGRHASEALITWLIWSPRCGRSNIPSKTGSRRKKDGILSRICIQSLHLRQLRCAAPHPIPRTASSPLVCLPVVGARMLFGIRRVLSAGLGRSAIVTQSRKISRNTRSSILAISRSSYSSLSGPFPTTGSDCRRFSLSTKGTDTDSISS